MITRRQVLGTTIGLAAGLGVQKIALGQGCAAKQGTVRDRLWLFAVPANADYPYHHRRSLMTPAEGAFYLAIPNILMIQVHSPYGEFKPPLSQYAIALRPLKRVVWSIVGSSGYTTPEYRREVMEMAKHTPNFVGLYMDDFFFTGKKREEEGRQAALTVEELREIRRQATVPGKKLDIWVTFYTSLLNLPLGEYLKLIDVLTLWTWRSEDLKNLESNFQKTQHLGSRLRKTLGCYFFDYTERKPLSIADMKLQCEAGLEWLRQGKIEGIVFLANTEEDLGFESVEWTREWIRKVGDVKL
ncbi:MAG: hypothetical protein M1404_06445 [Acidobacteria bacterium]|nr:hypothetical protein [Acidobacteriota bacterium]